MFNSRTPLGKTSGLIGETTAAEVGLERSDVPPADVRQSECKTGQRILSLFPPIQLPQSMNQVEIVLPQKYRSFESPPLTCCRIVPCRLECMYCKTYTDCSQSSIKADSVRSLLLEEKRKQLRRQSWSCEFNRERCNSNGTALFSDLDHEKLKDSSQVGSSGKKLAVKTCAFGRKGERERPRRHTGRKFRLGQTNRCVLLWQNTHTL